MATIAVQSGFAKGQGCEIIRWETLTQADEAESFHPAGLSPLAGSVQVVGTFGGATAALEGSNDNVNWVNLADTGGTEIGLTAAGAAEFSTAMAYIRPATTGGAGQDVDVIVTLRG